MAKNYSNKRYYNNNDSYSQHVSPSETASSDVVTCDGSKPTTTEKYLSWYTSSKNAYRSGRLLGWASCMRMDKRKFSKSYFLRGVKKGYSGRQAFEKRFKKDGSAAKCPKWAESSYYEK